MVSDGGIWDLSAGSLFLQSYQLLGSSPIGSTHEASRQASLFTTIWLAFKHAQKQRICQIHLCLCQLLSTCGNICSASSPFARVPAHLAAAPLAHVSRFRRGGNVDMDRGRPEHVAGFQWRHVADDGRHSAAVLLCFSTQTPKHFCSSSYSTVILLRGLYVHSFIFHTVFTWLCAK